MSLALERAEQFGAGAAALPLRLALLLLLVVLLAQLRRAALVVLPVGAPPQRTHAPAPRRPVTAARLLDRCKWATPVASVLLTRMRVVSCGGTFLHVLHPGSLFVFGDAVKGKLLASAHQLEQVQKI